MLLFCDYLKTAILYWEFITTHNASTVAIANIISIAMQRQCNILQCIEIYCENPVITVAVHDTVITGFSQ